MWFSIPPPPPSPFPQPNHPPLSLIMCFSALHYEGAVDCPLHSCIKRPSIVRTACMQVCRWHFKVLTCTPAHIWCEDLCWRNALPSSLSLLLLLLLWYELLNLWFLLRVWCMGTWSAESVGTGWIGGMWLVSVKRMGVAKILLLPLCVQLLGVFISGGLQ